MAGRKKSPTFDTPITIRLPHDILQKFRESEYDYWEDCESPKSGERWMDDEGDYHTIDHIYILLSRHRCTIEIRTCEELKLLWVALYSGTFQLKENEYISAKKIEELLKPYIKTYCPNMLINYPQIDGF